MYTKRFSISSRAAFRSSAALALAALCVPHMAFAQEAGEDSGDDHEIVVTGTLIRGIAPAGANVLATTSEDITASGATSVAQLMQTVPQLGSFGGLQQPLGASPEVAINRPNLRSLPGFNNGSGSTTLVLMNGHRLVGMGITTTTPDPDVIPAGVIERLEIVPDGGSAVYGSDAVAGVMNFVTIKRFDGVKVDGSYGFADKYFQWDANITAGKDWGSGSLFASYAYAKTDELLGRDRGYIRQFPLSNGYTELRCPTTNIEALAGFFAAAGTVRGANGGPVTQCDNSDDSSLYPRSERHSVYAGLTQELSDKLSVEITAYYTNRKTEIENGPLRDSKIIAPFPIPGVPSITSPYSGFGSINMVDFVQLVDFQLGANDQSKTQVSLDTWGLTSNFTYALDDNFQLRVMGNYGQSTGLRRSSSINETALDNAIISGLINPYNVASSNQQALGIVTNFGDYGRTRQTFSNFRAIVDGDIFETGAGAAKIALGLEYYREGFLSDRGQVVPGSEFSGAAAQYVGATLLAPAQAGVTRFNISRNVKSAFGELIVPLLGGNGGPELSVSAAGRYDDYSDVGDTFNPRLGMTFKPVDWVAIRGAWGKSFNAPGLGDNANADFVTGYVLTGAAAAAFAPPAILQAANGGPFPNYIPGQQIVAVRGNAPGITPQKATTWTAGIEIDPPFAPGLKLGATYYNIAFKNLIGLPPFSDVGLLYRDYGNVITTAPSQALLDAQLATVDQFGLGGLPVVAANVYAFFDARKTNLGNFKLDGIDFLLDYRTDTSFGAVFLNTKGTYQLHRKQSSTAGSAYVDVLSSNQSRWQARSSLGAEFGAVQAQVTWNHLQGYGLSPVVGFVPQSKVSSYDTFDLFFRYDVPGEGLAKDLAFTLNVNNVFETAPPVFRGGNPIGGQNGTANGQTLGRLVKLGVSKKF